MPTRRNSISRDVQAQVAVASGRRCCVCVGLDGNRSISKGQIAHLTQKPSDTDFDSLVWLCLQHHDEFDSQTSQSKGLMPEEVRHYRDQLYAERAAARQGAEPSKAQTPEYSGVVLDLLSDASDYAVVRERFAEELAFTQAPWRFRAPQTANEPAYFAYKSHNRFDGVCLIERIDLPDGRIVICCIAVDGNPGMSITNCVEDVCFQVCENFEIPPHRLVWLEHYADMTPDDWTMVKFGTIPPKGPFADPVWTEMTPELWRGLWLQPVSAAERGSASVTRLIKHFDWPDRNLFD
jgi:hypothetical protein